MSKTSPFRVFSGTNSRYLAEKICNSLGCKLGNMNIMHFADGEFAVSYEESIRGAHVFLVQSTFPNSDNLMELLLMIDAAKRASAKSIVAVIPYFGWARQDRKDKPRVSIGAKLVADLLSVAGIDRLITMDLHADQIQGFFNIPVDHLYASAVFLPYIQSLQLENLAHYQALSPEEPVNRFAPTLPLKVGGRCTGAIGLPGDWSPWSRFVRAAFLTNNSVSGDSEEESVGQFFHILGSVDQQRGCCEVAKGKYEITLYTSCCNTTKGIYYYTTYENHQINAVDMHRENLDTTVLIRYPVLAKQNICFQN